MSVPKPALNCPLIIVVLVSVLSNLRLANGMVPIDAVAIYLSVL
jgi:hypothetical protein